MSICTEYDENTIALLNKIIPILREYTCEVSFVGMMAVAISLQRDLDYTAEYVATLTGIAVAYSKSLKVESEFKSK